MDKETKNNAIISILEKVILRSVKLEKVEAERITDTQLSNKDQIKLKNFWNYSIKSYENNELRLTASFRLYFIPESLLNLNLSYIIVYNTKEELSLDYINENAQTLLRPSGDMNSLLTATLTDKMLGSPLIFPPSVEFDSDGNVN